MDEATTTTRQPAARILLYVAGAFFGLAIVLLGVGGPMFYREYQKERNYVETQCFVQSSSYTTEKACVRESVKSIHYVKCYRAFWIVQFGPNKTQRADIYGRGDASLEPILIESEKFSTGKTYSCWYNTDKSSEVTWYKPSSKISSVVLIGCGISLTIGLIILTIAFMKLRRRPDL